MPTPAVPEDTLATSLVRVTEAAALAAVTWIGRGEKNSADAAAVAAMRDALADIAIDGVVVIGEGEKDEAPMLARGERVGTGLGPAFDVAVDPIDGTSLVASGLPGALSVIALAPSGSFFDPGPCFYMKKIAVGPAGVGVIDVRLSATDNLQRLSDATGRPVSELTVAVVERPRHHALIDEIRAVGARAHVVPEGDIATAIACALPDSGIDLAIGIGGTPEGVIAAAALQGLGGEMQGMLHATSAAMRADAEARGYDFAVVLTHHHLVRNQDCLVVTTGITTGDLLRGVRVTPDGPTTHSLIVDGMRRLVTFA